MAVLIIDDSKLMRYQVRQMLPAQLKIFEAADGKEGFEKILELRPKLIILDCFMPKMNGWQVVNRMLAYPELSPIPVVLMTGRKDEIEDNAPSLFDYFVYDYFELMSKPFDREALVEAIKQAVIKAKKRVLEAPVSPVSAEPVAQRSEALDASPAVGTSLSGGKPKPPEAATLFPSGLQQVSFVPASLPDAAPQAPVSQSAPVQLTERSLTPAEPSPLTAQPIAQPPASVQLKTLQSEVATLRQQNESFRLEIQALKDQVDHILQRT